MTLTLDDARATLDSLAAGHIGTRPAVAVADVAALPERIRRKVGFSAGCWNWLGAKTHDGYGKVTDLNHKRVRTHRLLYQLLIGIIPDGLDLDHLCRNRACCNPDHLEPVTSRENTMRSPIALAAIYTRRTHCERGHPWMAENIAVRPNGQRICRPCDRAKDTERHARRRAIAAGGASR